MKYKAEMETFRRRLRGHIPDNRVGDIVQEMTPFKEEVIPDLVDGLGEGYFTFGDNAASVLAYIGDCQFVPLILERLEERATGQIKLCIDFIKNAALSATDKEWQCVVDSFIMHLTKRRDKKTKNYVSVILAILDALYALKALENIRVKLFLLQELETGIYSQSIYQKALMTYAEIDLESACTELKKIKETIQTEKITFHESDFRVVTQKLERIQNSTGQDFSIFTKDLATIRPYAFRYENGRVYFFSQGREEKKWFAGKADSFSEAIQVAIEYLEIFFEKINSVGNEKQISKKLSPFLALLEQHLDFKKWGFEMSYISPADEPVIIFDSQWCRVKFQLEKEIDRHETTEILSVSYGRLHAPNIGYLMDWSGEDHWCWHGRPRIMDLLHFLDGKSPEYLVEKNIYQLMGEIKYMQSPEAKKAEGMSFVEKRVIREAALWSYYGENLFRLFDLNNPEQWEKCTLFLKEYYSIENSYSHNKAFGLPEGHMIC